MPLGSNLFRRFSSRRSRAPIELLSRPGCHLCEQAEAALLREFRSDSVRVLNILEHRALEDAYVFRIPVVRHNEMILAEGPIDRLIARQIRCELDRSTRRGQTAV